MIIKLTEIGRLGDRRELHPAHSNLDLYVPCYGEMFFKKAQSALFIESTDVKRIKQVELPICEWIPKYLNEVEFKKQIPWYKRFCMHWQYEGEYKTVETVLCTMIIASNTTYLVSETPEQIMEMQAKS